MIRVGLTGGIGSGKSTVAAFFSDLGIPVYNSDREARRLMEHRGPLRTEIEALLGPHAYNKQGLNNRYIASRVFRDSELLTSLNALVHPAVRDDFRAWAGRQKSPYVIQEAAILFENGGYRDFDRMILVTAPEEERIRRVTSRDGVGREAVMDRMKHQWADAEKIPLADYVIRNDSLEGARREVSDIHRELLSLSGSGSSR